MLFTTSEPNEYLISQLEDEVKENPLAIISQAHGQYLFFLANIYALMKSKQLENHCLVLAA